jgi:MOSC domain-containing protein YiiM
VSSKPVPGVGKIPRDEVTLIANHGVHGDYHAGEFVRHRSRAAKTPELPNMRQVHFMAAELFEEVAAHGITVTPGAMGENVTTRGIDLFALAPGARLYLGESAIVEITGCRNPCNQLDNVDPRLLGHVAIKQADGSILRKAGIMGIVLEGGPVRPGDPIRIEMPAGAVPGTLEPI